MNLKNINSKKLEFGGDIHISAKKIGALSVKKLNNLGFKRDEFVNNTKCEISEYHGTYEGNVKIPSLELWNEIVDILKLDKNFNGGLEEEIFNNETCRVLFENDCSLSFPNKFSKIKIVKTPIGIRKKCDIHININLSKSSIQSVEFLDCLEITSFERMLDDEIHKIYTVTLDDSKKGFELFEILKKYLLCVPGLYGKMKFEICSNFYRFPDSAYVLPIVETNFIDDYLLNSLK
ncbi:MAG: hypothetical protein HRU03_06560 [Nanoarchaeales archaeon]|nr:hypothetical protein [Nanoarchaeales archaeon]